MNLQLLDVQVVAFIFLAHLPLATTFATTLGALIVTIFELARMDKYEKMKPFKLARLYDADGDLSKRWFVEFYVWDERKGKKVRKRYYQVNDYETVVERKAAAKKQIKEINELLQDGYYIKAGGVGDKEAKKTIKEEPAIFSIKEGFSKILEIKATELRKKSIQKITSIVTIFQEFIHPKLYLHQITKIDLIQYSDFLLTVRKVTPQTRNNHLRILKSLFGDMIYRGWLNDNPVEDFKKMKEVASAKNKAYSKTQRKQIFELADDQLKLTIHFIYYCFMRPNEVRLLKIKDIHLKEKRLFIPAEVAKNRKNEYITLPHHLIEILEGLNLDAANPEHYIIGKTPVKDYQVIPGKTPLSINQMSARHRKVLDKLDMRDGEFTLYSWKHTGVIAAYKAGVDIKSIQLQCRHYSLEMTDKYLKSLGLYRDEEIFMKMPKL